MAGLTPEEQKLLNELLKKQIELQAEGYSLSSSYLESLKEILGIRTRQTTTEANLLSVNKQINKEILNQKFATSDINELNKQIKKNADLINKAKIQETDLSKGLSKEDQDRVKWTNLNLNTIDKKLKLLEEEKSKSKELRDENLIKRLQIEIAQKERSVALQTKAMSQSARLLLYTQKQREELEKQNKEREKELKNLNTIGKAISDGLANTKLGKMKGQIKEFL